MWVHVVRFASTNTRKFSIAYKHSPGQATNCIRKTYIVTYKFVSRAFFVIMSKRMREHMPYLQVLSHCKPKLRKLILQHGSPNLVTCVCECALNILKGTVPLTDRQKRSLSRYKTHLRLLANKKVSRKKKKYSKPKRWIHFNSITTAYP